MDLLQTRARCKARSQMPEITQSDSRFVSAPIDTIGDAVFVEELPILHVGRIDTDYRRIILLCGAEAIAAGQRIAGLVGRVEFGLRPQLVGSSDGRCFTPRGIKGFFV